MGQLEYRDNSKSKEISIKEFIYYIKTWYQYIISKWKVILFFGLLGAVTGIAYSFYRKPIYNAVCTFVLEDGNNGAAGAIGQYAGIASMVGIDLSSGSGLFQGDNIIELYKSRKMVEQTLLSEVFYKNKKQLLIDRYIAFNHLRDKWKNKPKLKNIKFNLKEGQLFTRTQDSILGKIVEDINKNILIVSRPDKKLSIIKVEVNSIDEFFSNNFNDQIVKNVNNFYVQTKTLKSLQNVNVLQHQTDSVRRQLNEAISGVASLTDLAPNPNPSLQVLHTPSQRRQIDVQSNQAILVELVKNLEISKVSLRKETPLIQIIDMPILPLEKDSFGKVKGLILGGILGGLLTVIYLSINLFLKNILRANNSDQI